MSLVQLLFQMNFIEAQMLSNFSNGDEKLYFSIKAFIIAMWLAQLLLLLLKVVDYKFTLIIF